MTGNGKHTHHSQRFKVMFKTKYVSTATTDDAELHLQQKQRCNKFSEHFPQITIRSNAKKAELLKEAIK